MTIKILVLKSGEDVIADIKEIRQETTDELISYLFKKSILCKNKKT